MRGVNKGTLIGNATRDAELRHTQTGKLVSSIHLATNRQIKGEEEAQFHNIVCWDRLAETTAEYVRKGIPSMLRDGCGTAPSRTRKTKSEGWPRSRSTTSSFLGATAPEIGWSPHLCALRGRRSRAARMSRQD